jgi:hypothetical protein
VETTFEQSCARFSSFLKNNGYPDELIWITPQDILFTNRRLLYVKFPIPRRNLEQVHALFDKAMKEQSGISFSTACELDRFTCCKAWVPANDDERMRAMCSRDVKLSAATGNSRMPGKAVRSDLVWRYLRMRYKQSSESIENFFWG